MRLQTQTTGFLLLFSILSLILLPAHTHAFSLPVLDQILPPAGDKDCRSKCEPFEKELEAMGRASADTKSQFDEIQANPSKLFIQKQCGTSETNSKYESCLKSSTEHWGQNALYCGELKLYTTAQKGTATAAVAHSAAAAVCWASCFSSFMGATGLFCTLTGLGATAADWSANQEIEKAGQDITSAWWGSFGTSVVGTITAGGGVVSQQFQSEANKATAKAAIEAAVKKAGEEATVKATEEAGKQGLKDAAKNAYIESAKKAAEEAAKKAQADWASCVAAAFFSVSASVKWINFFKYQDTLNGEVCTNIKKLDSLADAFKASDNEGTQANAYSTIVQGLNKPKVPQAVVRPNKANPDSTVDRPLSPQEIANAFAATTSSDPVLDKIQRQMPNKDKLAESLKKLGLDLKDIARKGATGGFPATLSGIAGLPPGMDQLATEIDKQVRQEMSKYESMAGSYSSRGGSNSGSRSINKGAPDFGMFELFGGSKTQSQNTGDEVNFTKKTDSALMDSDDVWHSTSKGTLFQIVSTKLVKTRDRVENLDWVSPLNRALAGLPANKNTGIARSKKGVKK